jgi:uncharacterized membrane protein
VFVDLLRFVAAFQMLQGHTLSALLAPAYRVGNWYAVWSAARGLTSVAFLFAAGLAFQITTAREYASAKPGRRHARALRALRLIALGYLLHLPLAALWSSDAQLAWERFIAVDVLQCIGVAMLALEALAWLLSTPRRVAWASAALGSALLCLAPLAERGAYGAVPRLLAAYLTSRDGSLFPLLPWSAHVFLGVACGALVERQPARAAVRLAAISVCLFGAAAAVRLLASESLVSDQLGRLAPVVLASAMLAQLSRRVLRLPAWLQVLAGETLFLYVFHVLLVYGDGVGLAERIGPRLTPAAAILAALGVVLSSFAAALAYRRARNALADKPLAA